MKVLKVLAIVGGFFLAEALLVLYIDKPFAKFIFDQAQFAYPFFRWLTDTSDQLLLGYFFYKLDAWGLSNFVAILLSRYVLLLIAFGIFQYILSASRLAKVFLWTALIHLISSIIVGILKMVVDRDRPSRFLETGYYDLDFWQGGGDSFPSGHTSDYFALFLPLAEFFPRYRFWILLLPILIALGRLFLYAHYLSDVLFSLGLVWSLTYLANQFSIGLAKN